MINRREGLRGVGVVGIVAGAAAQSANGLAWSEAEAHKKRKCALDLSRFEPNSMLQVHESRVERARNGEVKTGGEDRRVAVRSFDWPAPGQLPFLAIPWTLLVSRRLENGSFTWLGRRKS